MRLLITTIYLSCFMMSMVNGGSESKQYCYDPPGLSCAEQHILECPEGQVITTDTASFHVSYFKNDKKSFPECQTENDECKNKTTCCTYINSGVTKGKSNLTADDNTKLIIFIKTECSFKSSCIVSSYRTGSSKLYDYIKYTYSCIPASKDEITFDLNGSTTFTGNRFPTIYYLDYTGNGTKDNDVILNRECIITTTERDITLTIKKLNLQDDDCCRFYISGYNALEYCSLISLIPKKGENIGTNTATIRIESMLKKDGDNFSILVKAAGNVTIDCREIKHVDKRDNITVDFLVNGSTNFTGNGFPTVYFLDFTGSETKEDVILDRECIVTTTQDGIVLTIIELNLQADECCRFHISGHNVSEYCPESGLLNPNKGRCVGNNTATIRLENVVNKDGDGFSILVKAAGNVTIDCRTIEHVDNQESTICQYPTTEFSSINSSMAESETNLVGIIGGTVGGLVVLVVIIIVVVVIMRRRRRPKKVDENNYYSTVDDNPKEKSEDYPKDSSNYSYIDIDLDKVGYKTIPNNSTNQVKSSSGKDEDPKDVNKKNPIFRRQDFSFVEGKFGNNKTSKDTGKPKGSNSKPDSNYTYTEIDLPKEDEGDDTYDHAQQGGERILNQKNKKEQDASDTYNHIGVDNHVAKGVKAMSDTYNHIGVNNDNAAAKGSREVPDTNNHIEDNNSVAKGARAAPDTYNHIGLNNSLAKGASSDLDTYNHIGVKNDNSLAKGANSDLDTYNHIGVKNDNSLAKGASSDLDTYNHIGVNNPVSKGTRAVSDTYNHIGVNNDRPVSNGDNSDPDT